MEADSRFGDPAVITGALKAILEKHLPLIPTDLFDAVIDSDRDGMTNRDEFRAGTDPTVATDFLRLEVAPLNPETLRIEFQVKPGIEYQLQVQDSFDAPWRDVESVAPRDIPRRVRIHLLRTTPVQYFRLTLVEP